jgi:hypothetical protein
MKVRAIRLWNVRKFGNRGVAIEDIGDGVNVLSAENEQGKSTCFDALQALLFQPHTGTPKIIQMLRPYSGGSPRMEADIEADDGLYRVTKQFYAGREATVTDLTTRRLVAQADQAEAWISDLTRGGASGPTGLLWVRQGLTDFESGGNVQQRQEIKAREDALASVAGEVEALTGGRRMAWILERCQEELDALVTATGQARKGGAYAEAREAHEQLLEVENDQARLVEALRDDLDERKAKLAQHRRLTDPADVESRRLERERRAVELEQAQDHANKLAQALGQRETHTQLHAAALGDVNRYRQALQGSETAMAQLTSEDEALTEALAAQALAQKAEEDADRELRDAEVDYSASRGRHRRAEAAGRAADALKQLEEQRARLQKAEHCQSLIEAMTGRGQALAIPDGTVTRLTGLDEETAKLRAKVEASSALVVVNYADNPHGTILVDGSPIADGEARPVSRSTRFDIPNIGGLTVSAGTSVGDANENVLRDKQSDFDRELENLGAADLASLKERERAIDEIKVKLQGTKAEMAAWAPQGVDVLRIEITRLEERVRDQDSDPPDLEKALKQFEQAETRLNEARVAAETARAQLSSKREATQRRKLGSDHLREKLTEVEKTLGPEEARVAKLDQFVKAEADQAVQFSVASSQVETLTASAPDLESAEASARRAASVVERANADIARLDLEIARLSGSITNRSDEAVEEALAETRDRLGAASDRVAALKVEIAVLERLKQALGDARADAREQYLGPVMDELRPLLALLFDEGTITFDDKTLLPRSLARNGQDEDVAVLSGGMREQLTVLTRLAFARLLARNGRPVPVILDDALVYSDDDRIEKMFDALHRQARDLQIIVFSCRQRAFENLGGQSLHMTDWNPNKLADDPGRLSTETR